MQTQRGAKSKNVLKKHTREKNGSKIGNPTCTVLECPRLACPLYIGVSGSNSLKLFYPALGPVTAGTDLVTLPCADPGSSFVPVAPLRARCAADCSLRAALRVRTPWLACCAAGWSPLGGRDKFESVRPAERSQQGSRARSESVLAPFSMLAWLVSKELIDLPFSH